LGPFYLSAPAHSQRNPFDIRRLKKLSLISAILNSRRLLDPTERPNHKIFCSSSRGARARNSMAMPAFGRNAQRRWL